MVNWVREHKPGRRRWFPTLSRSPPVSLAVSRLFVVAHVSEQHLPKMRLRARASDAFCGVRLRDGIHQRFHAKALVDLREKERRIRPIFALFWTTYCCLMLYRL